MPEHRCTRPQMFIMVDVQLEEEAADVDMDIESLERSHS
jgi:hypothetical protein